jgi:hypothetical protein
MGQRLELQALLENVLGTDNVYFQPPANVLMVYPCIIYKRDSARTRFAGNVPYRHTKRYLVTFVSQDPDSEIPDKLAALPMCIFDRHYAVKNLNHDVYSLFF